MKNDIARAAGTAALTAAALAGASSAGATPPEVFATDLRNPRGLNFAPNGALYVAEAGGNGHTPGPGLCVPSPVPPNPLRCYGETGAITRIEPDGTPVRVVTGLPALALGDGTVEGGLTDVAFLGSAPHALFGVGGDPRGIRSAIGRKSFLFGKLVRATPGGTLRIVADVAQHEIDANPFGDTVPGTTTPKVDTNPYSLLPQPGRWIVADAGANALVEVFPNGRTETFAVPAFATREPVPTSVAEGPDGAVYAGMLTAFPFFQGAARVQRFASDGSVQEAAVAGLTAVVDVTFDAGGTMYVLEVARGQAGPFPPPNPGLGIGRLLQICADGTRHILDGGLATPSGVAVGPDGTVYYTNNGGSPVNGQIKRVSPQPCP
jgi:DNA-binding beta-propeller fold protein YncE